MEQPNVIHIKNMVCNRCIMVVTELLRNVGLTPLSVELGTVVLREPLDLSTKRSVATALESCGFELLDDRRMQIVERVRTAVIEWVHYSDNRPRSTLSNHLRDRCGHDYSFLSKLFSQITGTSIEKYTIAQKIERTKELLVYDELSVGEIADRLGYSSTAHLSAQFRSVTGMTPSQFKRLRENRLQPLDKVQSCKSNP